MTLISPTTEIDIDESLAQMIFEEMAKYVFTSKYARYLPELKRRETWEEATSRVEAMHLRKYDFLPDEDKATIVRAFDFVRDMRIVPSMRSMQFGGPAIEAVELRSYNCAVRHIDSIRSFAEVFYLLLCGAGVGIGLSKKYLNRLPALVGPEDKTGTVITYVIEDTIEGWADSIEALLSCYFTQGAFSGRKIVFDYSKIRPAGAPLKTGGGRAPGYKGLKNAHIQIKALLDRIIEQEGVSRLRSIDAYDILMHAADAVLSGGVRRSATSVMFDPDDDLMMNAKTGDWWNANPQRARSNNSVRLNRATLTLEEISAAIERTKEWGEPGFVFVENDDVLLNPCFEISFVPVTKDGVCGVQVCNLTSITGGKMKSEEDLKEAAWAASVIGTLQAGYTNFPYLGHVSEELTREESLLGVSITGMMESPDVCLDPEIQRSAMAVAVETNRIWAKKLGIPQAARVGAIKPEGNSSLARGTIFSGIHPGHAPKTMRTIQANRNDPVHQLFKMMNPAHVEPSVHSANDTDDVVRFPLRLNDKAIFRSGLSAIDHLKIVKSTQQNWVIPGTTVVNAKPIHANVSCTITVDKHEWDDVAKYIFDNREFFTAVSMLPQDGDEKYVQPPLQEMKTQEQLEEWRMLAMSMIPVDYTLMIEDEDGTSLQQELSCAGGKCEI